MNLPMNLNDIDLWEKELLKGFALPLGFLPEIGEVVNILEPFKRLTIFEPVEKDGETTEKKVTVGIIYRSDGLYAWDNSRAIPNEYDEAIKWSPASQLPEYAVRRKAIVTKFEYKPLRSFTADDIKLLRLDYASQDDPQLLMEEYLPIKNFELLYGWWKQHYKATLKDCDNPQAIILAALEHNYDITTSYDDYSVYDKFEQPLLDLGWDVIVFVPSKEEDSDRITCGNALISEV